MTEFFRYPQIGHIAWLGDGVPRDDKLLAPLDIATLLDGDVVVEEKLDGANLGLSVGSDGALRAQNRGQYLMLPFTGQFARLGSWLAAHEVRLSQALSDSLIFFGEWCTARHSMYYDRLPDWWLMFDVYDLDAQRFWNTTRRNKLAARLDAAVVPCIHRGRVSLAQLQKWVFSEPSRLGRGNVEGLVVRKEDELWLQARAKLVHPEFAQGVTEHWRSRPVEWNRIVTADES